MKPLRTLLTISLTLWTCGAHATLSSFMEWENKPKVLCEQLLAQNLVKIAQKAFQRKFPNHRPVQMDVRDLITNLTLEKFRFERELYRDSDSPLFMKLVTSKSAGIFPLEVELFTEQDGKQAAINRIGLPDVRPTVWRYILLDESEAKLNYQELLAQFPITELRIKNMNETVFGYVTDFDQDGVRTYVSLDGAGEVQIGIDVPCNDLERYLAGPAFTRHVLTPWVELCRVAILGSGGIW